jgi:hypothetical protein
VTAKVDGHRPVTGRVIALDAERVMLQQMIRPLDAAIELGATRLDEYYGELQVLLSFRFVYLPCVQLMWDTPTIWVRFSHLCKVLDNLIPSELLEVRFYSAGCSCLFHSDGCSPNH